MQVSRKEVIMVSDEMSKVKAYILQVIFISIHQSFSVTLNIT